MGIDEVSRTLGQHGAQLENIEAKVDHIANSVELLMARENERKGGRRAVYAVASVLGGFAGAVGSAVASYLHK